MRKIWKCFLNVICVATLVMGFQLLTQRQQLRQELIRFHVVANSDAPQDQAVKLQVRDAVLESIRGDLRQIRDVEAAKGYLNAKLPEIQCIARETLKAAGFSETVSVSLCREEFGTRVYDTFMLPSGVYESLRIILGEGQGQNWWCVTFPNLCLPAASEGFEDVAAGAGFSEDLVRTLSNRENYEVRFFLLDALGRLENILHTSK